MGQRLRLYDLKTSRLPGVIGSCVSDTARIAQVANSAQQRLLTCKEAGEEGWWGTFAEVIWQVPQTSPYITLPREIARIESAAVCSRAVAVQNPFYQYLQFGNGRLPRFGRVCNGGRPTQMVARNNAVTFVDLSPAPQFIVVMSTDPADTQAARRVLLQGIDNNGATVTSQDGPNQVQGVFLPLLSPFSKSPMSFTSLTGIQKDVTVGAVQFFQLDPTTGVQSLIHTMEPGETTAWYRRYYLDALPRDCCQGTSTATTPTAQVSGIVKLEPIDVVTDTDYFLIQNREAMIEECQAVRYSEMDSALSMQLEAKCHANAVRHLRGELVHYLGKNQPAVSFSPFGSARLERLRVSMQ